MSNLAVLERTPGVKKRVDDQDIQQILERLEKLSQRPENPGLAYRNLETINALIDTLKDKLGKKGAVRPS